MYEELLKRIEALEARVNELELDNDTMPASSNPRAWERSPKGKRHKLLVHVTVLNCNHTIDNDTFNKIKQYLEELSDEDLRQPSIEECFEYIKLKFDI